MKEITQYVEDYVLFDIETTGYRRQSDGIIELSAVRVRKGKITEEFSELVNPNKYIKENITELTNITNEMVKEAPVIEDVIPKFINFVGNDVLIGHNIQVFDLDFIQRDIKKAVEAGKINEEDMERFDTLSFIDTLHMAKAHPTLRLKSYKLSVIAEHYGFSTEGAHRALADVKMNYEIYEKMRESIGERKQEFLESEEEDFLAQMNEKEKKTMGNEREVEEDFMNPPEEETASKEQGEETSEEQEEFWALLGEEDESGKEKDGEEEDESGKEEDGKKKDGDEKAKAEEKPKKEAGKETPAPKPTAPKPAPKPAVKETPAPQQEQKQEEPAKAKPVSAPVAKAKEADAEQDDSTFFCYINGANNISYKHFQQKMDYLLGKMPKIHIVSDNIKGVGSMAVQYAREKGYPYTVVRGEWLYYTAKEARDRRDKKIVNLLKGKKSGMVSFHDKTTTIARYLYTLFHENGIACKFVS